MANDDFERLVDEVAVEVLGDRPDLLERFHQCRADPYMQMDMMGAHAVSLVGGVSGDRGPRARLIPIIASWRAEREAEEVTPAEALARARTKAGIPAQNEAHQRERPPLIWSTMPEAAQWLSCRTREPWTARDVLSAAARHAPRGGPVPVAFSPHALGAEPWYDMPGFDALHASGETRFSLGPGTMATMLPRYASDILATGSALVAGCGVYGEPRWHVTLDPGVRVTLDDLRVSDTVLGQILVDAAQSHASDSQARPESGRREALVGLSNAPPPARSTPTGAGSAPRMTPQPAPPADWSKWAQLLQVEVWQGVALSLDLEPVEERDRARWGGMPGDPERYGPEFKSRLAVTVSHVRGGHPKLLDARADEARDVVYLAHFARWAEQNMEWRLPDRMRALAWGTAIRDPARWLRMETWTLHEAAHLLAGKEPVPPDRFDVHPSARGPEQDVYAALKDAVIEAKSIESFDARGSPQYIMLRRVRPFAVTTWANRSGWHVPDAFAQESQGPTAPTIAPTAAGVSAEPPEPVGQSKAETWQEVARRIAAEILARDRANDRHPSIRELAGGVAVRMRNEKIYGRQGKPLTEGTIERQALRGFLPTGAQAANVRGKRGKRGNR